METVQRGKLDSSAANPVVKGMPYSLFVLSYEVEMQTGYADTLGVGRGTESGQSALNVPKGLHSLMLRRIGERRIRFFLLLYRSRVHLSEDAVNLDGCEKIGIRSSFHQALELLLVNSLRQFQFFVGLKKRHYRKRRLLIWRHAASATIRPNLIKSAVEANHLTIELVESA